MSIPVATVIVCTRNRATSLRACLGSLLAEGSTTPFEVLVIDNASTDHTAEVVRDAGALQSSVTVRYSLETTTGLSHARNRGVAEAAGALLLFTDDDVLVESGWVDALTKAFDEPAVAGAGGRILPRWPTTPPLWLDGPHAVHLTLPDFGEVPHDFAPPAAPIGANMAVRAEVARGLAPAFDPTLGNRGNLRIAFEEWLFFQNVAKRGVIRYVPSAQVWHCIDAARMSRSALRKAWFQGGFGLAQSQLATGTDLPTRPRGVVRAVRSLRYARSVRRKNERSPTITAEDVHEECSAFGWAGRQTCVAAAGFPRLTGWLAGHLA